MISYSSGPTLGNLEAGAVASLFSLETAIGFWRYSLHRGHSPARAEASGIHSVR